MLLRAAAWSTTEGAWRQLNGAVVPCSTKLWLTRESVCYVKIFGVSGRQKCLEICLEHQQELICLSKILLRSFMCWSRTMSA